MEKEDQKRNKRIRILFFIGSLGMGGKERRLVELLSFLKQKEEYVLLVVTTKDTVELPKFFDLNIKMIVLQKNFIFYKFHYFYNIYKVVRDFDPDIIHTWGRMQTLYTLPTVLIRKVKLINGQITSAPPVVPILDSWVDKLNFSFSDVILSNSKAGLTSFKPPKDKSTVIYNGVDLCRFVNLPDILLIKKKYQITTPYLVLMVANFTQNKDHEKFFRIGKLLMKERNDVTWMGVGYFEENSRLVKRCRKIIGDDPNLRIQPKITNVEALINACDVGVLFSPNGEGISNAIIEYMALGKPVVANDAGGTKEIVINNKNGYLVQNQSDEEIKDLILNIFNNRNAKFSFGIESRQRIENDFGLLKMGNSFVDLYRKIINN